MVEVIETFMCTSSVGIREFNEATIIWSSLVHKHLQRYDTCLVFDNRHMSNKCHVASYIDGRMLHNR